MGGKTGLFNYLSDEPFAFYDGRIMNEFMKCVYRGNVIFGSIITKSLFVSIPTAIIKYLLSLIVLNN